MTKHRVKPARASFQKRWQLELVTHHSGSNVEADPADPRSGPSRSSDPASEPSRGRTGRWHRQNLRAQIEENRTTSLLKLTRKFTLQATRAGLSEPTLKCAGVLHATHSHADSDGGHQIVVSVLMYTI